MTRPFRIFSTTRLLLWCSNFPNLHNCGFFRLSRFIYLSLSTALQVPTAKTVLKWGRNIKKYFNSKICSCRLIKLFALVVLLQSFFVLLEFEMIGLNCWCAISKEVARVEIKVFRKWWSLKRKRTKKCKDYASSQASRNFFSLLENHKKITDAYTIGSNKWLSTKSVTLALHKAKRITPPLDDVPLIGTTFNFKNC